MVEEEQVGFLSGSIVTRQRNKRAVGKNNECRMKHASVSGVAVSPTQVDLLPTN